MFSKPHVFVCFSVWAVFCAPLAGQEFMFREFTTVDGLSHSTVFCTFQDRSGYLWFGTYEAIHKFDGQQFLEPLKDQGVTTNRIRRITQDSRDRIWIATHGGAFRLEEGSVSHFGEEQGLASNSVNDIYVDPERRIWFATDSGLTRKDANGTITYTQADGLPDSHVRRLVPAKDGVLWLATLGGLALFDGTYFQSFDLPGFEPRPTIFSLQIDAQDRLWLGTTTGLFCISREGVRQFGLGDGLPSESVWALEVDRHGRIWAGTDAGLCIADVDALLGGTKPFSRVSDQHAIGFTTIYSIDHDREGNLWFGTCVGLFQLTAPALQAYRFSGEETGEMVLSLLEQEPGILWLGTDRGVLRQRQGVLENPTEALNLPDTFVRCMIADQGGGIWFGTRAGAALRLSEQPRTLTQESGLPSATIFSLFQAPDGTLYLGTQDRGLAAVQDQSIQTWQVKDGLSGSRVYCLVPHPLGGLMIGTDRGIDWLRDGRLKRMPLPIPSCEVYAIEVGPDHTIWAGTHLGLLAMRSSGPRLYGPGDGLPDKRCRQLIRDRQGHLWVGTSRGLTRFDGNRFVNFHPPAPAPPFEMNHGAALGDTQGDLWFGHYRGALRFQPSLYTSQPSPLPVFLTRVSVFDQVLDRDQPLALHHDHNQITFSFQGLDYRDPERIRYRYRLKGYDSVWREITDAHVTFDQLEPGQYRFEVRAGNPSGSWSIRPATAAFVIHPPIWSRWWFRLTSLLLLGAFLIWQFQQLRLRNQFLTQKASLLQAEVTREKAAKLEREAEVKLLHSQMNPHFLQNAFTSAIYLVRTAPQRAEDMLLQLSQLFRRTMHAKRQVWAPLADECALITDYLAIQKVRFGNRLDVAVDCPELLARKMVPAFILQPLVENACIHGQKETLGKLHIQVRCEAWGNGVRLTIANNGRPFESASGPTIQPGHALDNINRRLALLNQSPLRYRYLDGYHHFSVEVESDIENHTDR